MERIDNYNGDFKELFTVEVDQVNRTCKTIGINENKDYILQINKDCNIGSGVFEYYLLTESELHDYNIDILYRSNDVSLLCYNDNLVFVKDSNVYNLASHPYEPCLYIKLKDKIIITIHNSFTVDGIISLANEKNTIHAITGKEYDLSGICNLLICAIDNGAFDTDISYLENNLIELTNDLFYKEYKQYPDCVLDYCIIKNNSTYNSIKSHKEAVIFAMKKWKKSLKQQYDIDIFYNPEKMKATKIDEKSFFEESSKDDSYCYLFLQPPHGNNYNINDFNKINNVLFPNGFDHLEIYDWSTDWSNYFDEGLEWWGAKCVSIYDNSLNRFVVIGASATD